ncbi:hypothetical protein ASPWEDRAFT_41549 [Aspergillus wentii DTO 134E9]|uniref:Fatty acid hydroxylase domain-containing protein n=1 Tax=Aspergillus wentii DTO 134E9 TaxID=1073089 RepID=A0A1L9RFP6_ASPWE|nr:uncharacterized protein ASPWEDRAFT_41549 [Aspergillus wentii DTO 134E9]KAI9925461.1 hypothetical protein MW887_005842 [Aspergillus wentii]OJJ33697.1 hypothetical protein ASPWEDRAFT_41549 [Aspergillus wentii DTO 134E9]
MENIVSVTLGKVENLWFNIVSSYSPLSIEFIGTLLVQTTFVWLLSLCYISLDTLFPSFSQRHKIQPAARQPSRHDIWRCVVVVAQNQVLMSSIHLIQLLALNRLGYRSSAYRVEASFPTVTEVFRDIILSGLMREVIYYYNHRLLHSSSRLYIQIHKKHHQFTAPFALATQFAHPLEHLLTNVLPVTLPPEMLGSHVLTFWISMALHLFSAVTVHSGYDFFNNMAKAHDLHHEKFNLHYGTMGLLDWIHGTDKHKKDRKE